MKQKINQSFKEEKHSKKKANSTCKHCNYDNNYYQDQVCR